jgi:CRP-like cAMP-binding protein
VEVQTLKETLKAHPFLEGLRPEYVEKLAALSCEVHFQRDQLIFREGDESSFFYLLLSGKVSLEVPSPGRTWCIQTVGAGDEIGWSSLLAPIRKQFQARCVQAGDAIAFDGARLTRACEEEPEFGYHLMRRVLSIVAERLQATRLQLLDVFKPVGAKMI